MNDPTSAFQNEFDCLASTIFFLKHSLKHSFKRCDLHDAPGDDYIAMSSLCLVSATYLRTCWHRWSKGKSRRCSFDSLLTRWSYSRNLTNQIRYSNSFARQRGLITVLFLNG